MVEFSLKQLEVFIKIAETRSFTKAANELYVTQSTVSAHMNGLEQALGTKLIARHSKKDIQLTPDGEKLYPKAKEIIVQCECIPEQLREETDLTPLQIGASTVPALYVLPSLLTEFRKQYPNCTYALKKGDSSQIHQLLLDGKINIGFVGAMLEPNLLEYYAIAEDHIVLTTPNNEYYRGKKAENIFGKDLLMHPMIARELGSGTERVLNSYLMEKGYGEIQLNLIARVEEPEVIKKMVMEEIGIAVLSSLTIEQEVKAGKLLMFELDESGIHRNVYMAFRKGSNLRKNEKEFIKFTTKNSYYR